MRMRSPASLTLLLLASLVCLAGCGGDKLASVKGIITLDGKPIQGLEVTFEPTGADTAGRTTGMGYTKADGSYSLFYPGFKEGTPPGEYIVSIAGGESLDDGTRIRVPKKYNAESTLTATVVAGKNSFDFDLTSK